MTPSKGVLADLYHASMAASREFVEAIKAPHVIYDWELLDRHGDKIAGGRFGNVVTREGAAALLSYGFRGTAQIATWYLGLIGNANFTAPAQTNTAAQITTASGTPANGWNESTAYSGTNRGTIAWSAPTTASNNIDMVASAAVSFAITGTDTINGAFVASAQARAATTGVLYSAGTMTAQPVVNTNTLNITPTLRLAV